MKISVKHISVAIKGKKIFSDISFDLNEGELIAITGPSGCGKTTLLNCIGLTQPISSGDILINGINVIKWKDKEKSQFWHNNATFIYQDYGIIEEESVLYNVTLNKNKKDIDKVKAILKKVGLSTRENELAMVLSGGEKQRLGIARAIFKDTSIIYADEPTASLDSINRELVVQLLKSCAERGSIVVLATHDDRLTDICDKVIKISE